MDATLTTNGRTLNVDLPELTDDIIEGLEQALAMYQAHLEREASASAYDMNRNPRDIPSIRNHRAAYVWLRTVGHQIHQAEVAAEEGVVERPAWCDSGDAGDLADLIAPDGSGDA